MSSHISCPCCGATIEIEARSVQAELPLGPIEIFDKKKLAKKIEESLKSDGSDYPIETAPANDSSTNQPVGRTASCEEDLIESVREIIGEREFVLNSRLWRHYQRICPRALHYAVEDWKLRTPDQQRAIKNRPAWLTDRYKRALAELEAGKKLRKMA